MAAHGLVLIDGAVRGVTAATARSERVAGTGVHRAMWVAVKHGYRLRLKRGGAYTACLVSFGGKRDFFERRRTGNFYERFSSGKRVSEFEGEFYVNLEKSASQRVFIVFKRP